MSVDPGGDRGVVSVAVYRVGVGGFFKQNAVVAFVRVFPFQEVDVGR